MLKNLTATFAEYDVVVDDVVITTLAIWICGRWVDIDS